MPSRSKAIWLFGRVDKNLREMTLCDIVIELLPRSNYFLNASAMNRIRKIFHEIKSNGILITTSAKPASDDPADDYER